MPRNYFENELLLGLNKQLSEGALLIVENPNNYFEKMYGLYPTMGSKIAWSRVPGSISERLKANSDSDIREQFLLFFERTMRTFKLKGPAVYLGDGAIDFAVAGDIEVLKNSLKIFLDIPHHHYFVCETVKWCLSLTMELDMHFGEASLQR